MIVPKLTRIITKWSRETEIQNGHCPRTKLIMRKILLKSIFLEPLNPFKRNWTVPLKVLDKYIHQLCQ